MGVMAREQSGVRPNDRPIVTGLLITYGLFWIGLAIAPVDRQDWFLENLLAVALVAVLVLTHRRGGLVLPSLFFFSFFTSYPSPPPSSSVFCACVSLKKQKITIDVA